MGRDKSKKYDLDKTEYDVVIDDCEESVGFEECLDNLENLLIDIYEKNKKPNLSTKLLVQKSKVGFENNKPFRYSVETIKTISNLLEEYKEWENKEFDLEKVKEKREFYFEVSEKQREKNDAWGPYMYVTRVNNDLNKINEIMKNSKNENEAKSKIKKQGLNQTYKIYD